MKFKLKEFREAHSLFQSDIARILNLNQSTVSRMELRPIADLDNQQYELLSTEFGEEEVNKFTVSSVRVAGNTNMGNGNQTNSVTLNDGSAMSVIQKQSETLSEVLKKQSEQTDRLLTLLEKLSERL